MNDLFRQPQAALEADPCAPAWDEGERLAALHRYGILDTAREAAFDNIVDLAADLLEAPIAVVNLIEDRRQWFKAETGIGVREMPLDLSICRHAILQSDMLVVPDLAQDARFAANPLVSAENGLRFYAGALLVTPEGLPLGTVCVLDTRPRPEGITPRQRRALASLAAQAMAQIELRHSEAVARQERARAEESASRLAAIFGQAPAGLCEVGLDGRFLQVNDALCIILGRGREELLGLTVAEVTAPESIASCCALMAGVAATGEAATVEKRYLRPDGGSVWASSSVSRVPGPDGKPLSFLAVVLDITGRRRAEERQTLLSREVDHRAKNALTVVLAALRLTRAPDLPSYIRAIEGRVAALARAQTLLAEDSWHGADLETLLRGELTAFLADGGANSPQASLSGPALTLPPGAAQPLAIAMHELATNAVKYGALSTAAGRLLIEWRVEGGEDGTLHLRWAETGGPAVTRLPTRRGFGSRVLEGTVREQLGGQVLLSWPGTGLVCDITVPLRPSPAA